MFKERLAREKQKVWMYLRTKKCESNKNEKILTFVIKGNSLLYLVFTHTQTHTPIPISIT